MICPICKKKIYEKRRRDYGSKRNSNKVDSQAP